MRHDPKPLFMPALLMLVLGSAFAGCLVNDPGPALPASFDEALQASGPVVAPQENESSVRLKLIEPVTHHAPEGETRVVVLLFDDVTREPVEDAEFVMDARMPAMGHGTSPEEDPVYERDGLYVGMTTFNMPSEWILEFEPRLADDTILHFEVPILVGGVNDPHGHE